jgi:hypothetical protein
VIVIDSFPFANPQFTTCSFFSAGRIRGYSSGGKLLVRRALLASSIAIAAVLGTSGCNFTSPVSSLDYYAPSDGAQADIGNLKARNLISLQDEQGNSGVVGAFANSGSKEITFAIKYTSFDGTPGYREYTVGAYQVINFGYQNNEPLDLNLGGMPGDIRTVLVYTDTDEASINVPVMDATLVEYADLVAKLGKN